MFNSLIILTGRADWVSRVWQDEKEDKNILLLKQLWHFWASIIFDTFFEPLVLWNNLSSVGREVHKGF